MSIHLSPWLQNHSIMLIACTSNGEWIKYSFKAFWLRSLEVRISWQLTLSWQLFNCFISVGQAHIPNLRESIIAFCSHCPIFYSVESLHNIQMLELYSLKDHLQLFLAVLSLSEISIWRGVEFKLIECMMAQHHHKLNDYLMQIKWNFN